MVTVVGTDADRSTVTPGSGPGEKTVAVGRGPGEEAAGAEHDCSPSPRPRWTVTTFGYDKAWLEMTHLVLNLVLFSVCLEPFDYT